MSAAAAAILVLTSAVLAEVRGSKRDAELMRQKVATITALGLRPSRQTHRTTLTEPEINAYLAYEAPPQLPVGVVDPSISIMGPGRVAARAIVDLDAVRKARPAAGLLDPRAYLIGHVPVTATGILRTTNGVGRFELESATIGGVPVPKLLLQEILSFYSKTPDNPAGLSLDDPFALPARIREIQVQQGQAIIVQ